MHPGLHRNPDFHALVDFFTVTDAVWTRFFLRRAEREDLDPLAVEPQVEMVLHVQTAYSRPVGKIAALHFELDGVLAVERKVVVNRRTAARPERQLLAHAVVLPERQVRNFVGGLV